MVSWRRADGNSVPCTSHCVCSILPLLTRLHLTAPLLRDRTRPMPLTDPSTALPARPLFTQSILTRHSNLGSRPPVSSLLGRHLAWLVTYFLGNDAPETGGDPTKKKDAADDDICPCCQKAVMISVHEFPRPTVDEIMHMPINEIAQPRLPFT